MRTTSSTLLVVVMALAGCGGETPTTTPPEQTFGGPFDKEVEMEIGANRAPCQGEAKFFCLLTREGTGNWGFFYDGINGLDPQWGQSYRLKVGVRNVPDPPADGSSLAYYLEKVLDRQPVAPGTTFSFDIDRDYITDTAAGLSLTRERPISCAPALCGAVRARLQSPARFRLSFQHPTSPDMPLVLTAVSDAVSP